MKKTDILILFFISLGIYSINFVFQQAPGYMDADFYYIGGQQILHGDLDMPVVWNYLDEPTGLPNPIFSYWMPFPSMIASLSMWTFGENFFFSRVLFWLLAAGLAPLTYWLAYQIYSDRFTSIIAGSMAIMSGYYFKYLTIPETILPYIFIGSLFFYFCGKFLSQTDYKNHQISQFIIFGCLAGLLHLTRVDGILFFFIGLIVLAVGYRIKIYYLPKQILIRIIFYILAYILVMSFWYLSNLHFFDSIFSPASSKALWIATYDDTFIFPASKLTFSYWLQFGANLRISQILSAIKSNAGSFLAVQTFVFGFPLIWLGWKSCYKKQIMRVGIIYILIIFIIMSFVFPLSGERGGFLHSASAVQILVWILIAIGFDRFIRWGINKRNWSLRRSRLMFGSAFLMIITFFTTFTYFNGVIGKLNSGTKWGQDYENYKVIETVIEVNSKDKTDVIMINNPLGYYYETGRWSIVFPNSDIDDFSTLIYQFNVQYIVIDKNLPNKFNVNHKIFLQNNFTKLKEISTGIIIYGNNN